MRTWNFYTSKEIKPEGWIKRQLEIQASGLSGNLDKVWPDVRDSAWIGGDREGWERMPYWLDGFIPLAYLLNNEDMIARVKKYMDIILERQKPSGWICPCEEEAIPEYDLWAVHLISKVLVVYYECSGDERIPDALYRMLKNYYELLESGTVKLFNWGKHRWFEAFVAIEFLQKRYKEDWLLSLARILKEQGADYSGSTDMWKKPVYKVEFETHIVAIAMMLKHEAISCDVLGESYRDVAERFVTILREYNGTPVGAFTGDEHLSGLSPIQGTELCSVVEQMYSYEWLFAYTGERKWAERLELLAFNALPATISDDMWAHQYDQMSNQIACQKFPRKPIIGTNNEESHLFGLQPHYGCCTSNFNQAWPKLTLSAFMHRDNVIISAVPVPALLNTDAASIVLETNYPFENQMKYKIEAKKDICFKIRIPSFATNLRVNGRACSYCAELSFDVREGEKMTVDICFDTVPELIARPHDLKSVRCGSLVFALPIKYEKIMLEYERKGIERKYPYCDYEYIPVSDWNYAYSSPFFELERREISEIPFSSENPPIVVKAEMKKIPWGFEIGYDNVCAKVPAGRLALSDAETIELYPYGCAKLRMTEIPLID